MRLRELELWKQTHDAADVEQQAMGIEVPVVVKRGIDGAVAGDGIPAPPLMNTVHVVIEFDAVIHRYASRRGEPIAEFASMGPFTVRMTEPEK